MKGSNSMAAVAAGALVLAVAVAVAAEDRARVVRDPAGRPVKSFTESGATVVSPPGGRQTDARRPGARSAEAPTPCAPPVAEGMPAETRDHTASGVTVDACGRLSRADAVSSGGAASAFLADLTPAVGINPTIARMTTRGAYYGSTYTPGGTLLLLGSAETYTLSDSSSWSSGAGTIYNYSTALDRVEVAGSTVRYVLFAPPYSGAIYQQTDYNAGDHSAQGTLAAAGPLVLEATIGSNTAVMRGTAVVVANEPTWYGEPRFNYYAAIVGAVVPFEQTYVIGGGATWQPDTFARSFSYANTGVVDFAHPVSVPRAVELKIGGPAEVPDRSSIQFSATVRYENGVLKSVTTQAVWEVEPAALATVSAGLLTTAELVTAQETLTLAATYDEGDASLTATKSVVCRADASLERSNTWPMFQGNARHTGYVPLSLHPADASLRWERSLAAGHALNPVTGADGRVFASVVTYFDDIPTLFALNAATGDTLWSKAYGDVFSVNPPSTAYGTVYVQTGNHSDDTWFWGYDARNGDVVFQTPLEAQWERYYAPTLYEGKAYVNGGYYGGMYGLDAFSGGQTWFADLPQYDEWTPAVAGGLAYSYVGSYEPGLYAVDRITGRLVFMIPDPAFDWNGWSMDLAPVVGAHDNVLAIHDGRLISFNTAQRNLRWQKARGFAGQPSVAGDRIYAVDGPRVVVLDEQTGADLWSWQPPEGAPVGPIIVTNTHFLASTATRVHAVDLTTRASVWSYPIAGHLALADGNLYVASADGSLTAIAMPEAPGVLSRLEIAGPAQVAEGSSTAYRAYAYYTDGRVVERTLAAVWSVEPNRFASIAADGTFTAVLLIRPAEEAVVRARYTEGDVAVEAMLTVNMVVDVTIPELIRRNVERSLAIKERLVVRLDFALEMEREALALRAGGWRSRSRRLAEERCALSPLCLAIRREAQARIDIVRSIELLTRVLDGILSPAGPEPQP